MNKKLLFALLLAMISLAAAHTVLPGSMAVEFMYGTQVIWDTHDFIHWIFVVLMLYTCYDFRHFYAKHILRQPSSCIKRDKDTFAGERKIHKYHRYFWRANAILIAVHWWEAIMGWLSPFYTYSFSHPLGIYFEAFFLVAFTAWLGSCHFFKYFLGYNACAGCGKRGQYFNKAYNVETYFNIVHPILMWLAIASFVLILAVNGHL